MLTVSSCFSLDCFLHCLPLLWLMSMPLFAAVWGKSVVVQQCFITFVLIASSSAVPPILRKWIPCVDSFLLVMLLSWPYQILPNFVIWLTSQLFWLVEPIIQGIEAFTLVTGTCFLSQKAVEVIDYQPMFGKTLVLTAAGVAYIFSSSVIFQLLSSESTALYWILAVLMVFMVILHIATIVKDEGIISDAAVICFLSLLTLYVMKREITSLAVTSPPQTLV
ncbi:uncharacterized protein LOC111086037, partial [Limulus polyphemus]|uniref:Uncharacterized protein LOC111086037 n=1 Tax=Limulus polyphemus TaxID=6850 RepID=A0ABM1SHJ2_LIMPO